MYKIYQRTYNKLSYKLLYYNAHIIYPSHNARTIDISPSIYNHYKPRIKHIRTPRASRNLGWALIYEL